METAAKKKRITIGIISVALIAILIIIGVVLSEQNKAKKREADLEMIEWTSNSLFSYSINKYDLEEIKENIKTIAATPWMNEAFIKQGVTFIQRESFSSTYGCGVDCFAIKEKQILLEELGYESAEIRQAYEDLVKRELDKQIEWFGFAENAEDVMIGSMDEEALYNQPLSYYTDPKSVYLKEYLPQYLSNTVNNAIEKDDTSTLLELCRGVGIISQYANVSEYVDVNIILNGLKNGAEVITVKDGEGYYGNASDESRADFEKDEIWSEYLPGDYITSTTNSVKYYGDLASTFYSTDNVYKDENGNIHNAGGGHSNSVYLKGERISFESVSTIYIKYAYEDGMISYHKNGYCFAISDRAIVCFVDKEFYFNFQENEYA